MKPRKYILLLSVKTSDGLFTVMHQRQNIKFTINDVDFMIPFAYKGAFIKRLFGGNAPDITGQTDTVWKDEKNQVVVTKEVEKKGRRIRVTLNAGQAQTCITFKKRHCRYLLKEIHNYLLPNPLSELAV